MKPHVFPMICVKKRCSNNQVHTSAIASQFTRLNTSSMATWDECQPLFTVWLLNETARDMQTISRCHYNHQSTTPSKTPSKPFFQTPAIDHMKISPWPYQFWSNVLDRLHLLPHCRCISLRSVHSWGSPSLHPHRDLSQTAMFGGGGFFHPPFLEVKYLKLLFKKEKKRKFQTYSNFPTPFHMTQLRIPNSWVVERWRVETTRQNNGCRKGILNLVCSFYGLLHE